MPIGVFINSLSVVLGGLIGGMFAKKKNIKYVDTIMLILGICALCMGVNVVVKMRNLPAVILSVILGTLFGEITKLDKGIIAFFSKILRAFKIDSDDKQFNDKLLVMTVLACASGTGIYGALLSGMTGDHSILIAKAILDLFTAAIFAISLSYIVSLLGVFQLVILGVIFLCAKLIMPLFTQDMISDFVACGGIIMVATGLKIASIKDINIANMIPSLILVMPLSYLASLVF